MKRRHGQVALYLALVLVALAMLVLMNVGAFVSVRAKNHAMNAGDAAALAAARVQAELLNRIGRLNIEHAEAEYVGDWQRAREIVLEQARLAFLGPLQCLEAAGDAARANGASSSSQMAEILNRHVTDIRSKYMNAPELYPEPWEGAWEEYAQTLSAVVSKGVVAGADNIDFADAFECFPLTSKSFYSMVFGAAWCKLVVAGWTGLLDCDSHNMPRPAANETQAIVNCEICSLHLVLRPLLLEASELSAFRDLLALNGAVFPALQEEVVDTRLPDDPSRYYFFYDEERWRPWVEMDPTSKFRFPILGKVKPEFDVLGCAAVFRVYETIPRLLSETTASGSWAAAAKPFGTIRTSGGTSSVMDEEARGLVLPAFEAVRLIPLSAANADGQDLSTADAEWIAHIREHVPQYLSEGVKSLGGCRYCHVLVQWEDPDFRSRIASWISEHGASCTRVRGTGSYEGGTSYAH